MLHGGNQGSSSDFFMGSELSELVEDGGVAKVEVLGDIFKIPVDACWLVRTMTDWTLLVTSFSNTLRCRVLDLRIRRL